MNEYLHDIVEEKNKALHKGSESDEEEEDEERAELHHRGFDI